jgi:hypothetical protein
MVQLAESPEELLDLARAAVEIRSLRAAQHVNGRLRAMANLLPGKTNADTTTMFRIYFVLEECGLPIDLGPPPPT